MEAELTERSLMGVAAILELGGNLAVAMEAQRALANEVGPRAPPASALSTPPSSSTHLIATLLPPPLG